MSPITVTVARALTPAELRPSGERRARRSDVRVRTAAPVGRARRRFRWRTAAQPAH